MSQSRQLAAIMFTDIVGYTALMGKDSAKALELVRISKEIQKPLVEKHQGQWLKEMGDGALAMFGTATDAVNCAIEIQRTSRADFEGDFRIGIHLGDVTIEENDVYGDGVNVASRLESIADPGGIYISESIEKAIQGQTDVQAKYLGEVKLKNVAYGVRTYAVQGVGLPVPEVKDDKELSGHFLAEVQRRGVLQAGAAYVVLSLLLILLLPYASSLVNLPVWSSTALLSILIAGFPVALYLAWNYEQSPEGFIKTTSQQSWQNPLKSSQRKPLTGTLFVLGLLLVAGFLYLYPKKSSPNQLQETAESSFTPITIEKSIAVLPFVNMSDDPSQDYFSDGLSEELLNLLAKIPELKVIGRTSSFSFKGKNEDLRAIGKKLGVSYLMEGSVRKSGDNIRVTVQLIKVSDGSHAWSETYNRKLVEIFEVQDDIAARVVDQLKISIPGLVNKATVSKNLEAYNLLLESNHIRQNFSGDSEKRIELMERAIKLDSTDARIWAGLASAYSSWSGNYKIRSERTAQARKAAEKAISLDDENAEAYHVLGEILWAFYWDWENAEKALTKAEELDPNLSGIKNEFYYTIGQWDKSIAASKRRIELDPINPGAWRRLGLGYLVAGRANEAISPLKRALDLSPNMTTAWLELASSYSELEQYDKALETLERVPNKNNRRLLQQMAQIQYKIGDFAESELSKEKLLEMDAESDASFHLAKLYGILDEADLCFKWLDIAYERRSPPMVFLKSKYLHIQELQDPRYEEMLERMNLPLD